MKSISLIASPILVVCLCINVLNFVMWHFHAGTWRLDVWVMKASSSWYRGMIYDILEPVRNYFLSQVSGMTSSFRWRKKSVRQKTEQRLKAKEVLSATGYLKNYNLEAFDEMSTSRCKMENLVDTGEKSCSEYLGQLKQCSNRSLCFIIGLVLMSMLIYEKCDISL